MQREAAYRGEVACADTRVVRLHGGGRPVGGVPQGNPLHVQDDRNPERSQMSGTPEPHMSKSLKCW